MRMVCVWGVCAEGAVTNRQGLGCLAHRKMQNGWTLNLNPTANDKPCVPQAGQGASTGLSRLAPRLGAALGTPRRSAC